MMDKVYTKRFMLAGLTQIIVMKAVVVFLVLQTVKVIATTTASAFSKPVTNHRF